ncbi:MAG: hypothetical protein HY258_09195 [Chloroflexi bacterium]|nr:hypothetical protein [Chloroflexota bacterium]
MGYLLSGCDQKDAGDGRERERESHEIREKDERRESGEKGREKRETYKRCEKSEGAGEEESDTEEGKVRQKKVFENNLST